MARITKADLEAQVAALNAQVAALQAQIAGLEELGQLQREELRKRGEALRTQQPAPAPAPVRQAGAPSLPNWQAERLAAMAQAKELAMRFGRSVKVAA